MSDWIEKEIARFVKEYGVVPPPWARFPDRHPYSICWRMGGGEEHIMAWGQWWHSQNFDEEQRIAYFQNWKPPARWLDWMIDAIWEIHPQESEEDFDYSPYFSRIEKLGFGSKEDYEKDLEDPKWLEFESTPSVELNRKYDRLIAQLLSEGMAGKP
jgi:hypothetical protein